MNGTLTTKSYWETYYENKEVDCGEIDRLGSIYDRYWSICINRRTKSVIEIGAFPGRFLSYVAKEFGLHPTALDYQADLTLIEENLHASGIKTYDLINEDFLSWQPKAGYDLVISIGFVEHFDNYYEVIAKHCKILNEGGSVFFQVPNKRLLRKLYGTVADRANLKAHNLDVMSLEVFRNAALRNDMRVEILEYFGPFQFGLHGENRNAFRQLVFHLFRFVFKTLGLNSVVEKYPSKFWSASIICVMKKR